MWGFDSKYFQVHGIIKDLKVYLAVNRDIDTLMDVVVIHFLDAWGMILSRKWFSILGGNMQMDFSYATILTLDGKPFILYRELVVKYHVENIKETNNQVFDVDRRFSYDYNSKNSKMSIIDQFEDLSSLALFSEVMNDTMEGKY